MASKKNINQANRKKTTAKRRAKTTTRSKKKQKNQSFLAKEITIWLTLAICIFLVISNFGAGGTIGNVLSEGMKSIFGWIAYIFPVFVFGMVAFLSSNQGNSIAYVKAGAGGCLMVLLCVLLQLINDCGGKIGEGLVRILKPAIGVAGTSVVTCILIVICIVVITERSILRDVKKNGEKVYGRAREDMQRYREGVEEKRQIEREQKAEKKKRIDHMVTGVSFDTTLTKEEKKGSKKAEPETILSGKDTIAPEPKRERKPVGVEELVINRSMPLPETEGVPETIIEGKEESFVSGKKEKVEKVDIKKETEAVEQNIAATSTQKEYCFPPMTLLKRGNKSGGDSDEHLRETAMKLQKTLQTFGVQVTVTNISCGPAVTRYELHPEMGVKVSKIVGLSDDIKLNLAAEDIRIEAPIPGKSAVGIEVPNKENTIVMLRDLLESQEFKKSTSKVSFATGRDISGKVVVSDIAKMPHLLVAGATGSGKSVCINTLIMSIIYKAKPEEVKLIMIDPKVVELSVYNGIPHLMIPVVTDPKKAAGALNWAVTEMNRRYQLFAEYGVRDLKGFNEKIEKLPEIEGAEKPKKMPLIVIIVDELADLMMVAPGDVEDAICRLAQLARAAGLHLVLATQRPSVNVITGLIKANMPSRIAFSVTSGVDSRTILDMNGAEKLLGKGDMLFHPAGFQKPIRVQGAFVSDEEVQNVVRFLKEHQGQVTYDEEIQNQVNHGTQVIAAGAENGNERDVYFVEAGKFIIDKDKASIGMLQRVFKIGFNRAARIMDQLAEAGVVGEEEGTKPRKVLMSMEEFEQYIDEYV